MTILCWNCQGLGHPGTVRELVCLVRKHRPSVVFISETRQCKESVMKIRGMLGLKHCITHDGFIKGVGIALFWDDSVEINLLSYGSRYIDVHIRESPNSPLWRGTFVYGEPRAQERHHMWNLIRRIKPRSAEPWMMIGDFNATMWQGEHFSATKRSERHMSNLREVLGWCNLYDLGYRGPAWTFDNKQKGKANVKARLDRGTMDGYVPAWSDTTYCDLEIRPLPLASHSGQGPYVEQKEKFQIRDDVGKSKHVGDNCKEGVE